MYLVRQIHRSIHWFHVRLFSGAFGLISESGGKIQSMYLGKGRLLQKGNYSLEAAQNVYATIYQVDGNWFYSATGP